MFSFRWMCFNAVCWKGKVRRRRAKVAMRQAMEENEVGKRREIRCTQNRACSDGKSLVMCQSSYLHAPELFRMRILTLLCYASRNCG